MGGLNGNLYLIGYRASGKSSVGRVLGSRLRWPFLDMDREIERRTGRSIRELVEAEGWEAFRLREKELVREIAQRKGLVVATGGGVVLDPRNVEDLRASGLVVLLWVDPEEIVRRLAFDPQEGRRPPLKGDLLGEVREVLEERREKYFSAAHLVVEATSKVPEEVAQEILRRLRWETPLVSSSG